MHKSTLVLTDDHMEDEFDSVRYSLSYDFHKGITEGYGYEIGWFDRIFSFRD